MSDSLGFDVATGISESALNALLPKIYKALYPTFLKDTINVDEVGISSVTFNIQAPPTICLATCDRAKAVIKAAVEDLFSTNHATLSAERKSTILDVASSASFTVTAPKVALTVNYSNGSPSTKIPSASLEAYATVNVEGTKSELTFKILSGTIDIPGNPTLSQLLNKALLPFLTDYLNKNIFTAIKIPPLGYKSLKFSAPLPVVSQALLAAFSSLGSTPPTIPGPLPWPQDGLFIAADIATLEAAANLVFPLGPQQNFSWNIFSGHVGATLSEPKVTNIADDGTISASIEANASCQLTMDTPSPLPNLSLGPSATASLGCSLRPSVDGGELKVTIASIPSLVSHLIGVSPAGLTGCLIP